HMSANPLQVFIIYAREDEPFRAELKAQFLPMERAGLLRVWTDRELVAGEYWEPAIRNQLQKADIILLLVKRPTPPALMFVKPANGSNICNEVIIAYHTAGGQRYG
ncbi:MAG: toll/interleukin-1 receptor domain-containing protein, partial [Thermoanaerobaculia bacterium]|nr:toll/interleukin-1 receptor domain-containing protein [Thermoanaerobaculia bacterium]